MASLTDAELREIHNFLINIAERAGKMITAAHPQAGDVGLKKNSVDLVTETDQAVEKMVSTALKERYPDFKFMGEETYQPGDVLTPSPTFIVDPIDGTTNFVHSYPYACISLGLAIHRRPAIGVIYNPFTRLLYHAISGHGAFLTDKSTASPPRRLPLQSPAPLASLAGSLVIVEWGSDRAGNDFAVKLDTFGALARAREEGGAMVHSLRSCGSAALNMCAVAAGQADAYWEAGCWAWDVCAGWCVLEEAGGYVVDANPGGWEPKVEGRRYLCVRGGEGKKEFVEEFWRVVKGRFEVGVE
ncbi:inositol monophosphatase [Eremomyces bilateralis CBS 781.70]|uniref:Inositol-1-monophosphatase n=1 Tax=Eremomyces bilateralis CBS 781.70 TaxID=1392243 RepID=A0A6G1G3Z3_9PEZI|nr:inositol monophosphatase [Eremomyces bilateralis CBS 781.70]KAF1812817.1 inositol monophosphatase [Eremomyces bilateralis CBS 781.70]